MSQERLKDLHRRYWSGEGITAQEGAEYRSLVLASAKQYRSRARLLAELLAERGHYWRKIKLNRSAKYHRWAARLREVANG